MANITKKRIVDDILILLTRFSISDDSRLDPDWISEKADQVREQLIVKSYQEDGVVDYNWLTDLSLVSLNEVTYADDPNITFCNCDISKVFIPQVISLWKKGDGNIDLGVFSVMSACGTKEYFPFPMSVWRSIPSEHVRSKFNYYARINTAMYVNKVVDKLLIRAILAHPEDGYIIDSSPVDSGNIQPGIEYIVKFGSIVYNGTPYAKNSTFTGITGSITFTGTGTVYLKEQAQSIIDTYPYPVSAAMARQIVLEICTKEFQLEASQITDFKNNSVDDQEKAKLV